MAKGRVNRRAGVTGSESLPEVPRPFADNTKLSGLGSRTTRLARADLSFPRRRPNVVQVPARGVLAAGVPRLFVARRGRSQVLTQFRFAPPRPPRPPIGGRRGGAVRLSLDPRVGVCVQRKQRKQVLFALGRAGYRGSVKAKTFRRSYNSQWRC